MSIFDHITLRDVEHFLDAVDRSGGPDACWPWTRACFKDGYGMATISLKRRVRGKIAGNTPVRANRMAYFIATDTDPKHSNVCHSCDVRYSVEDISYRRCCNPAHLWLGTARENSLDMVSKGRALTGMRHYSKLYPELVPRGEKCGRAKLTEAQAMEIKHTPRTLGSTGMLARKFGVSEILIRKIRSGSIWKHLK
jgi:hypothetical protein